MIDGHLAFAPKLAYENEGLDPAYFKDMARLESGNFWYRTRDKIFIWAIKKYFPDAQNLLEVGCGTGGVLSAIGKAIPKLKLTGSEIFSAGLKEARVRIPGTELFQMDALRIPFKEEFDIIGLFDVLEHIKDDEAVIGQLFQAVKKDGGVIICVPQHPSLWSHFDDHSFHVRRYTARDLRSKLESAGFKVSRQTSFVTLLLPAFIVSRLMVKKAAKENYDHVASLKVNPLLNLILEGILSVECALIRAGISLPVGTSLLMVARKP